MSKREPSMSAKELRGRSEAVELATSGGRKPSPRVMRAAADVLGRTRGGA